MHRGRQALLAVTALVSSATASVGAYAAQPAATDAPMVAVVALSDWKPDITRDNAMSVDALLDMDVYGAGGEDIGEVENLLIGADGRVLSLVAEVGGLWGVGDTHTNIPWDQVKIDPATKRITLPITEDTVGDYSFFKDEVVSSLSAATRVGEVSGDGIGGVQTGPSVWRVTDLIGDTARLKNAGGYLNYGSVDDVVLQDGKVSAVLIRPGYGIAENGLYAVPFFGSGTYWNPIMTTYDIPYTKTDIEILKPVTVDLFSAKD